MKQKTIYVCESCDQAIYASRDLLIVKGEIVQMAAEDQPDVVLVHEDDVAYHRTCLGQKLGLYTVAPAAAPVASVPPTSGYHPGAPPLAPVQTPLGPLPAGAIQAKVGVRSVAVMPDNTLELGVGTKVVLRPSHPLFSEFGMQVWTVSRHREADQDYALARADSHEPLISKVGQMMVVRVL